MMNIHGGSNWLPVLLVQVIGNLIRHSECLKRQPHSVLYLRFDLISLSKQLLNPLGRGFDQIAQQWTSGTSSLLCPVLASIIVDQT
ncbi:hypothetical protein RRG08_066708 [Elysia crispata]|uniref:Uncharacterized protein n=1 Tax=Elysia crispata TaxID=231223 RepID=A0AAE1B8B7_9GAST|nr:hypothetical protein RRG08_066708 [Elysia crispata]